MLGYRLVGALRILPAAPEDRAHRRHREGGQGHAVVPVKNTGNTLDPVSGRCA